VYCRYVQEPKGTALHSHFARGRDSFRTVGIDDLFKIGKGFWGAP
jgi:hypothetical protein